MKKKIIMKFFHNHYGLKGKCGLKYESVWRRNLILLFFLPLFWLCKINSTYFHMRKSLFFSIIFLFYFVRRLMNLLRGWCTIYTPHAKNKVYIFLLSSHSNSCDKSSGFFSSVFVLLDKYEKLFRSVVHQWYCWEIISLEINRSVLNILMIWFSFWFARSVVEGGLCYSKSPFD